MTKQRALYLIGCDVELLRRIENHQRAVSFVAAKNKVKQQHARALEVLA